MKWPYLCLLVISKGLPKVYYAYQVLLNSIAGLDMQRNLRACNVIFLVQQRWIWDQYDMFFLNSYQYIKISTFEAWHKFIVFHWDKWGQKRLQRRCLKPVSFCSTTSSRYCPTNQNRPIGMVEQLIFNLENEIETNLFSAPASGCYVMMSKLLRNTKVDTVLT